MISRTVSGVTLVTWVVTLYACYMSYISPASFNVAESVLVVSMVIVGGAGTTWGPVAGAFLLVGLPEALWFAGFPGPIAANLRQIVYGLLLVVLMMHRPGGLLGGFSVKD